MPKLNLYNVADIRFHSGPHMDPLMSGGGITGFNHAVWHYATPMIHMEPQKWTAGLLRDFRNTALQFEARGLTASQGESALLDWTWDGATATDYGRAVVYLADMFDSFYASRGITHDGYYAWWPHNFGVVSSSLENSAYMAAQSLWYMNSLGPTADALNLYTWSGATTVQQELLRYSPFINLTSSGFGSFFDDVIGGMLVAREVEGRDGAGVQYPSIVAMDNEDYLGAYTLYQNGDGSASAPEMGTWIQALNDSRALTGYRFFDKNLTLFDLWGATGATSSCLRSPGFQYTIPMGFSAANGNGSFDYGATANSVEVVWDNSRSNTLDYQPNWDNFVNSFYSRHRQHILYNAFKALKTISPSVVIGNYQDVPSSKLHPDHTRGKILRSLYTCDVEATGAARALSGHGVGSGVTGTFPFDYACPVLYVPVGAADAVGYQNFLPGVGSGFLRNRHTGAYGTSSISTYSGTGIFANGSLRATYVNWLQRISVDGVTGVSGSTADGYSGNNLTDLRNWWRIGADSHLQSIRGALDQFPDNTDKSIIPWLGSINPRYTSIFGPTGTWVGDPTYYPDVYGLTGYSVPAYDPTLVDYNVTVIKNCIKNYGVTNFFLFCSDIATPTTTMDFWYDVFQTLILDSESETGGQTGGGGETGDSGEISPMLRYYPGTSRIMFGGKIYTREEFEYLLDVFYRN